MQPAAEHARQEEAGGSREGEVACEREGGSKNRSQKQKHRKKRKKEKRIGTIEILWETGWGTSGLVRTTPARSLATR
eukprot:284211-Rhodomonas_salina.1